MTSSSDASTTTLTSAPAASAPGAEGGPRPIPHAVEYPTNAAAGIAYARACAAFIADGYLDL